MSNHDLINELYTKKKDVFNRMLITLTGGDEQLSMDLLHDGILKIMLWKGELKGLEHLSILFTKVLKQLWSNHYSRSMVRKRVCGDLCGEAEKYVEITTKTDYYPYSKEIIKRIKRLTKQQQKVITGTFFENLSDSELCRINDMKQPSVWRARQQALNQLKKREQGSKMHPITYKIIFLRLSGWRWPDIAEEVQLTPRACQFKFNNTPADRRLKLLEK